MAPIVAFAELGSQSDVYLHFGLVRLHSGSIGEKLVATSEFS
jgi:hypothetical protein